MSKVKRQSSIKNQFVRHVNYCKTIQPNANKFELKERLKNIVSLYQEFKELQNQIEEECGPETVDDQYVLRGQIEDYYFLCVSNLETAINAIALQEPPPVNANQQEQEADIKITRCKVPQFSGDYKDWPSFKDLYLFLVHNNTKMKNVQKFYHLRDNVFGEAKNLIKSMHVTDNNYALAWKRISDRYEHKRYIVDSHLRTLFGLQPLHSEDSSQLKNLIDSATEIVDSLQVLGLPVNQWDTMLVHVIASKLDQETHKQWELKLNKDDLPTFDELVKFLEARWQSLEMISKSKPEPQSNTSVKTQVKKQQDRSSQQHTQHSRLSSSGNTSHSNINCTYCAREEHTITSCGEYLALSYESKISFIKSRNLCFNCLRTGHSLSLCKSKSSCMQCGKRHHTTIHRTVQRQSNNQSEQSASNSSINSAAIVNLTTTKNRVLLATAVVNIVLSSGDKISVRALVDLGSEHSIVQEKLAKQLGLIRKPELVPIIGIGGVPAQNQTTIVKITIASNIDPNFKLEVDFCTMKTITASLPTIPVQQRMWPHLQGIKLADQNYHQSAPVQMLLGAEVFEEIVLDGIIKKVDKSPTAMNSYLGWLLFGKVNAENYNVSGIRVNCLLLADRNEKLDKTLRAFWELEEVPTIRKRTVKEQQAENIYQQHISINTDGRYQVPLLFDPDKSNKILGSSRQAALQCLYGMEKRFKTNPVLKERYLDYMNNLIQSGHMELVPVNRINVPMSETFYLPHHAVLKESSSTTKLRVVFNASRKSTSGVSLNEKLLVGPTIQEELYSIITRWRMHFVAFIADIEKMFRQVKIVEDHRDYQRLVWRFSTHEPVQNYRITTVIDGTACATFLAAKTLQRAGEESKIQYPAAAQVVIRDFYMDDVSSGSHCVKTAIKLQQDLINLLKTKGFILRKWLSNAKELMESIPVENMQNPHTLVELIESNVKTLGVYWNYKEDCFQFKVQEINNTKYTKREVLSDISSLFDPIGWLSPTIVMAKIFIQSLWSIKTLSWDNKIPQNKQVEWEKYRRDLSSIENIRIPRWIGTSEIVNIQLHGFADASNLAYAAVVYARVAMSDQSIKVSLISGKTKVAPLKTVSTPRLELCGCVLLSTLITKIKASFHIESIEMHMYSDSTIALAWITSHPNHWNIFVANRVTDIQQITDTKSWHFVDGEQNPADCASRGVEPSLLKDHTLWWNGPSWLSGSETYWKSQQPQFETDLERRKVIRTMHVTSQVEGSYMEKVLCKQSSLFKLQRITAYILRWLKRNQNLKSEIPSAQEYATALTVWIKFTQSQSFGTEIQDCINGDEIPAKSKLMSLRPFVDPQGILRVGGRLRKSDLPYQSKYPIILPKRHHLTKLIIEQAHKMTLHGGPSLMSSFLKNYWIFGKSEQIKRVVSKCVTCFPYRCKPQQQIMADLPKDRVIKHRAFLHSGIDYAGPIYTKNFVGRTRGKTALASTKSYVAIFVCFSTKAIHIELVSDQTTVAFIEAYKRFTARRGKISDLYSDCGTYFIGADRTLREQLEKMLKDPEVKTYLAKDGTNWHFNPPATPHFGGLWEAGVKSVKYHIKRLCGENQFTFEEMTTLLSQIEACLNSRPLCPMNDELYDTDYLTPGHFLIGEAPITVPQPNLIEINSNQLSRWQLTQKIYQQFWKCWSTDYLSKLQQRTKWLNLHDNVKVGQLVLYREDNLPPTKWPIARIIEIHTGDDQNTRTVTLKTPTTILKRPIDKISILPIDQ